MEMVEWAKLSFDSVCVIGDLNARSSMIYDVQGQPNAAGRELTKYLEHEVMICVNDETHTFGRPGFATSVLDVCLVTKSLLSQCQKKKKNLIYCF